MLRVVNDRVSGCKEQLSYYAGLFPVAPVTAVERASARLRDALSVAVSLSSRRILPALARLDSIAENLPAAAAAVTARSTERINAAERLLDALSPMATLRRGYSITRVNGRVVSSPDGVAAGDVVETTLAGGVLTSVVKSEKER